MAVPAKAEQNYPALARLARRLCLLYHRADGVGGLGCGDDALSAGKAHCSVEGLILAIGAGLYHARPHEPAEHGRIAVVAKATGVHRRGHEVVSQREHRHERREPCGVTEVIAIRPPCEGRTRRGLGRQETHARLAA